MVVQAISINHVEPSHQRSGIYTYATKGAGGTVVPSAFLLFISVLKINADYHTLSSPATPFYTLPLITTPVPSALLDVLKLLLR
jgi:hypothetical protein